jgi:hypothetical protein
MFELHWAELCLYLILAFAWGRYVQWRRTIEDLLVNPERYSKLLTKYAEGLEAEATQRIELRVEWQGDHCYLYRVDTDEFVGQGRDVESAINNASRLVPNSEYVISKEMVDKPKQNLP